MDGKSFVKNNGPLQEMGLDIKIGKAEAAVPCLACKNFRQGGVYIIVRGRAILLCMRCTVEAILKYQEQFPTEKLFESDVNVHDEDYERAARAMQGVRHTLSDSDALELAKVAINSL